MQHKQHVTIHGKQCVQVNKTLARRMFNNGATVYAKPCKQRITQWWEPIAWNKQCYDENTTFDQLVNRFTYYNCGSQLGYYPQFFVPVP